MLWLEHDRYDQFVLLRCLDWFAEHGAPPRLELVGPRDFPGSTPFVGIGQLPPEALRLLWERREPIHAEQLEFARRVWSAFRAPDPRPLAALARDGTPLLRALAGALHRHLHDLPSLGEGLGLTHRLLLEALERERDWLDSPLPERWVGGVRIAGQQPKLGVGRARASGRAALIQGATCVGPHTARAPARPTGSLLDPPQC